MEGLKGASGRDVRLSIDYCDNSIADLRSALGRILRTEPRTTAIYANQRWLPFTTLTFLMNNGMRVPQDISLIARDDTPDLAYLVPSVARYVIDYDVYARRLRRMTQKCLEGNISGDQKFIIPTFQKGDSIGPRPDDH